jgi:phospholipase/lecithinase/hemolysin
VAERLGQAGDAVNAGLSLGVFGSLPGTGNNYAVGGARTGGGGALGILDALVPTGITAQVNYYLSTRTPEAGALYLFSGGGNDLRDAAALSTSAARISAAESAADTLIFTIYSLYQAGGRNFFITNGPNVGFIPEAVNGGTFAQGIEASVAFNNRLFFWATVLDTFPGFELAFFDLYSFYNSVFIDTYAFGGAQYGFTSATIPCYPGTPGAKACDVSLFFDDIHPTAKLHRLFGDQAADLILSKWPDAIPNPEPSTILLTSSALLIGWRLARRRRA